MKEIYDYRFEYKMEGWKNLPTLWTLTAFVNI